MKQEPFPVPHCPPEIPHRLAWDRIPESVVIGQRPNVWVMADHGRTKWIRVTHRSSAAAEKVTPQVAYTVKPVNSVSGSTAVCATPYSHRVSNTSNRRSEARRALPLGAFRLRTFRQKTGSETRLTNMIMSDTNTASLNYHRMSNSYTNVTFKIPKHSNVVLRLLSPQFSISHAVHFSTHNYAPRNQSNDRVGLH
jgi:hypothetical protein